MKLNLSRMGVKSSEITIESGKPTEKSETEPDEAGR
jgi:hypothetical protein